MSLIFTCKPFSGRPVPPPFQWLFSGAGQPAVLFLHSYFNGFLLNRQRLKVRRQDHKSQFLYGHPAWLYNHFTTLRTKQNKKLFLDKLFRCRKVFSIWPWKAFRWMVKQITQQQTNIHHVHLLWVNRPIICYYFSTTSFFSADTDVQKQIKSYFKYSHFFQSLKNDYSVVLPLMI